MVSGRTIRRPFRARLIAARLAPLGLALAISAPALAVNPISTSFAADPSPHVFGGRIYLYATNDQGNSGGYWDSTDWRLLTSTDVAHWRDEGPFLSVQIFKWARPDAKAWAPEAAFRGGKYFFYAPIGGDTIGVAVSDKPQGPFTDARGSALVDKARDPNVGAEPIDPAVLIDDDGQAYMVFGSRTPKIVKLKRDMIHTDGPIQDLAVQGFPAEDPKKAYGEAPFLHKYRDLYYFSFSSGWPGQILYATSRRPTGPYTYRGVVLDYRKISTNHHAIMAFRGRWYLFYHDNLLPGGGDFRRALAIDDLTYNPDGTIREVVPTRAGVTPIGASVDTV
jgi:beta-xylosidase